MQFGISIPHLGGVASLEAVTRVGQEAEAMGYDSAWVSDHIVVPQVHVERFGSDIYDPLVVLSYLAAQTNRIKLGTSTLILPYRNPVYLAKAASTLDVLSNGRLILGVGSGWLREEFDALAVSFEDRGAITDETIAILKELWTSDTPSFQGRFWSFSDIAFGPKPVSKPHLPIWVAGSSPRSTKVANPRSVRRAVEFGDAWHPFQPTLEDISVGKELIRVYSDEQGRDPNELIIAARHPLQIWDGIGKRHEKHPMLGTVDQITKSIEDHQKAGTSYFVLDHFFGIPELSGETVDSILITMDKFAQEIMPKFG